MKTKQLIILGILLTFTTSIYAQFKIDAQYRVRGQALHGYKKPVTEDTDAAFHIGQRTRLNLRYNTEKYSTLLSIQDVRTWGDENNVNGTGVQGKLYNNMDIYEAWINIKFNKNSNLKIGRQEMKYDDQRHISWRNWWDTGLTYDAATYSYNNKETGWRFDVSASYNSRNSFTEVTGNDYSGLNDYFGTVNPMQTQNFIYVKRNFDKKMYLSFMAIASGYQKENTPDVIYITGTEGLHLNYNATKKGKDGLFGVANAFMQNGKDISGTKISASMFTAQLGYRTMEKKLEISAKMERLSGNDAKNTDSDYLSKNHTYNLLYGARHPYYEGFLDWFVLPKSTKNAGLMNIGVKLSYKMSKKDILWFEYSNVSTAYEVFKEMDGSTPIYYDKALASTLDFTYIRKVSKDIKWMNGFSYGIPTDDYNAMKGISSGGSNYFFYTMITFTPKFFDSSK
jgi:hypothetical protein